MPPNHLILCPPLLLLPSIFPSIRVFSNESVLRIRWPKYWSFNFNFSPSSEHPGLISFRMDWISLQSKSLSRVFSNTTVQKHQFFSAQLSLQSNSHIHTWVFFPSPLILNWGKTDESTRVHKAVWRALEGTGTVSQFMARHLQDTAVSQGLLDLVRPIALLLKEQEDKMSDFPRVPWTKLGWYQPGKVVIRIRNICGFMEQGGTWPLPSNISISLCTNPHPEVNSKYNIVLAMYIRFGTGHLAPRFWNGFLPVMPL